MPQRHVMALVKLLFSNLIARNRAKKNASFLERKEKYLAAL